MNDREQSTARSDAAAHWCSASGDSAGTRQIMYFGGLVLVLFAVWSLSSPLMSAPDEPAHAIKAASIWRGQLRGPRTTVLYAKTRLAYGVDTVRVPQSFADLDWQAACYRSDPSVAAGCPPLTKSGAIVRGYTSAGPYPPLYYAIVGWPSRWLTGTAAIHLMRLTSALLNALMVTLGFGALYRLCGLRWALLATLLPLTPMTQYLAGVVNPNGLEITASIASAFGLIALAGRRSSRDRWMLASFVLGSVVMVNTRTLSLFFWGVSVGFVVLYMGWAAIRELLRERRFQVSAAITALGAIGAASWVLAARHWENVPGRALSPGQSPIMALLRSIPTNVKGMVALFGWLDTPPGKMQIVLWGIAVAILVFSVWRSLTRWRWLLVAGFTLILIILPLVLQYPSVRTAGIAWQGRYILPLVPALSGVLVWSAWCSGLRVSRRSVLVFVGVVGCDSLWSHAAVMRRYIVGLQGPLNYFGSGAWTPLVPPVALFLTTAAAVLGFVVLAALGPDQPRAPVTSSVPTSRVPT